MDENDPLKKLIDLFKSEGYIGKEAVEKAETELERRRKHEELERKHELQMKQTATGKTWVPCLGVLLLLSMFFLNLFPCLVVKILEVLIYS